MPKKKIVITLLCIITLIMAQSINAYAAMIPEDELKTQVESRSKTEVSGNVFIWFLCAVAFLKISQKIDSFMGSLGINVGNTGGSMISEVLLAARGLSIMKNIGKGGAGGSGAVGSSQGSGQGTGFASGTFANMVRRNPANNTNISNNPAINQNDGNPALNTSAAHTNNALAGSNNGNPANALPSPAMSQLTSGGEDTPAGLLPELSSVSQPLNGETFSGQGETSSLPFAPQFTDGSNPAGLSTELSSVSPSSNEKNSAGQKQLPASLSAPLTPQFQNGENPVNQSQGQPPILPTAPLTAQVQSGEGLHSAGQRQIADSQSELPISQMPGGGDINLADLSQPLSPVPYSSDDENTTGTLSETSSALQISDSKNSIDTLSKTSLVLQSADSENPIGTPPASSISQSSGGENYAKQEQIPILPPLSPSTQVSDSKNSIGTSHKLSSAPQITANENSNALSASPSVPHLTDTLHSAVQGQISTSQSESLSSQNSSGEDIPLDSLSPALSHINAPQISNDASAGGSLPIPHSAAQIADCEHSDTQGQLPVSADINNPIDISQVSSSIPQNSSGENPVGAGASQISFPAIQSTANENFANTFTKPYAVTQMIDSGNFVGVHNSQGNMAQNENMSELSPDSFVAQMGYAGQPDIPTFSNLQAGGGMITGIETSKANSDGIGFSMYNAVQYAAPEGNYKTVEAADKSKWYKQYSAADKSGNVPPKNQGSNVIYDTKTKQKLPPMPQRKDGLKNGKQRRK